MDFPFQVLSVQKGKILDVREILDDFIPICSPEVNDLFGNTAQNS
jgi:hypothetical protein